MNVKHFKAALKNGFSASVVLTETFLYVLQKVQADPLLQVLNVIPLRKPPELAENSRAVPAHQEAVQAC